MIPEAQGTFVWQRRWFLEGLSRGGGEGREVHLQSGGHELIRLSMDEDLISTASVEQSSSNEPGDQNEGETRQRDGGAHRG